MFSVVLLGWDTMWTHKQIPTLQRNMETVFPSTADINVWVQCHNPEDEQWHKKSDLQKVSFLAEWRSGVHCQLLSIPARQSLLYTAFLFELFFQPQPFSAVGVKSNYYLCLLISCLYSTEVILAQCVSYLNWQQWQEPVIINITPRDATLQTCYSLV